MARMVGLDPPPVRDLHEVAREEVLQVNIYRGPRRRDRTDAHGLHTLRFEPLEPCFRRCQYSRQQQKHRHRQNPGPVRHSAQRNDVVRRRRQRHSDAVPYGNRHRDGQCLGPSETGRGLRDGRRRLRRYRQCTAAFRTDLNFPERCTKQIAKKYDIQQAGTDMNIPAQYPDNTEFA